MLHHTSTGPDDAPPVLFLHGFMGRGEDWAAVAEALSARHRCVTVDLAGHGRSKGLPNRYYSMDGVTEALCAVLDALQIGRATVVGYSMGGRVALFMGLHRPERCRRLVLESASPGLASGAEREARRGVDEARAVRLETKPFDAFLDDWYRQPLFASLARHEGLVEKMAESRTANDPRELARVLRGLGTGSQPSLWDRLAGLTLPTLAVAGALDGKYVDLAERMAVRSDFIHTVVVAGVGHNVHAEAPDAFAAIVADFVRR